MSSIYIIFFIASYKAWLKNVVHYTHTLGGKRKLETYHLNPFSGQKFSKDKHGNAVIQSAVSDEYENCSMEQINLENMRLVISYHRIL